MGYIYIVAVGIIWLLTLLTSLKGWFKLIVLTIAILLPPFRNKFKSYINAIWVADDQDVYTLFGGTNADITISDRVGRECIALERRRIFKSRWHQAEQVINLLFFWQKDHYGRRNHCRRSIEHDEGYV